MDITKLEEENKRLKNQVKILQSELLKHTRLSIGEYAEVKGVSRQLVSKWVREGKLKVVKKGSIRQIVE